nr:hypothetical protein [Tanacetum cinerariifolium]
MTKPTMEEDMMRTQEDYSSGITRPKFDKDAKFELKGQFPKELCEPTFSGSENEDANEHIERVLEIVDLYTTPNVTSDQLMLREEGKTLEEAYYTQFGVPFLQARRYRAAAPGFY